MSAYQAEQEVVGNYRLTVTYDEWCENPVENNDGMAHHVWDYDRDEKVEPEMREVIKEYLNANEVIDIMLNKLGYTIEYWNQDDGCEPLMRICDCKKDTIIDDVEVRDYFSRNIDIDSLIEYLDQDDLFEIIEQIDQVSAIRYVYRGYSQGDYADGFSYLTYKQYLERGIKDNEDWHIQAEQWLTDECEYINHWMCGDCWHVCCEVFNPDASMDPDEKPSPEDMIDDDSYWDSTDCDCCGFIGDWEDILNEFKQAYMPSEYYAWLEQQQTQQAV